MSKNLSKHLSQSGISDEGLWNSQMNYIEHFDRRPCYSVLFGEEEVYSGGSFNGYPIPKEIVRKKVDREIVKILGGQIPKTFLGRIVTTFRKSKILSLDDITVKLEEAGLSELVDASEIVKDHLVLNYKYHNDTEMSEHYCFHKKKDGTFKMIFLEKKRENALFDLYEDECVEI